MNTLGIVKVGCLAASAAFGFAATMVGEKDAERKAEETQKKLFDKKFNTTENGKKEEA